MLTSTYQIIEEYYNSLIGREIVLYIYSYDSLNGERVKIPLTQRKSEFDQRITAKITSFTIFDNQEVDLQLDRDLYKDSKNRGVDYIWINPNSKFEILSVSNLKIPEFTKLGNEIAEKKDYDSRIT